MSLVAPYRKLRRSHTLTICVQGHWNAVAKKKRKVDVVDAVNVRKCTHALALHRPTDTLTGSDPTTARMELRFTSLM